MINFDKINACYRQEETACIQNLLSQVPFSQKDRLDLQNNARALIEKVRTGEQESSIVAQLMQKYQLSSVQGLTLMCLAEALLRIPDSYTANQLLSDKLPQGEWDKIFSKDDSLITKVSNFALRLAATLLKNDGANKALEMINKVLTKTSEPFIREATRYTMKLMAQQFIVGRTIEEALKNAEAMEAKGYRYSYDMLGEAAVTYEDAEHYFESYKRAINAIGRVSASKEPKSRPSISVKLSALHPRYEALQHETIFSEILSKVMFLAKKCQENNLNMTIDAEEADLLELSLEIFEIIFQDPQLKQWQGLGLAVQAYQKRAPVIIDELAILARSQNKKIYVRLVKGAYWDNEIKRGQVNGLNQYPVYTRKPYTDLSYLICAKKLMDNREVLFPEFGTHNAYTVASVLKLAGNDRSNFEFQRLHGMGYKLYENIVGINNENVPCRIYAPVGSYNDLLPYLVRRLLENGANSSFVHHLIDHNVDITALVEDPITFAEQKKGQPHPKIPLPVDLYSDRTNSFAFDLSDRQDQKVIRKALEKLPLLEGGAIITGQLVKGENSPVVSPYNKTQLVGHVHWATKENVELAFSYASKAFPVWTTTSASARADCLYRMASLMEKHCAHLMALCVKEAGKTIPDALAEVREAVDFCRYYAVRAEECFSKPKVLNGPTGELNQISLHGRGIFICISPWNFPLAIFTGQVAAALVAGNCVLAKPANPTTLIATEAVKLFHEAGIPAEVLHLLPGSSQDIGQALINDERTAGIALTGSVATGQAINRALAQKNGPIVPLIAETGGQNVMIVDSSALLEQVTNDVMTSSFQSAGQRCSALRILFLQDDIAERAIEMIKGAMKTLIIHSPEDFATDVAPVITRQAQEELNAHIASMKQTAKVIYQCHLPDECARGTFVAPTAIELPDLDLLDGEKFGPILHIIRYKAKDLDTVIDRVNDLGFGLTLGIHSRIQSTIDKIRQRLHVGNTYVNRSMIGAVVGVQPFGGEGLSGTGPKAGGPHYLHRFVTERTLCVNTTAQGGNAALMMLEL